jgi:general nucleoside transport system ATP-binding protein
VTPSEDGAEVVLRLDSITKRFGSMIANDAINLSLHKGEVVALLGENGAGKTTLMNILFGHYVADSGAITAFSTPLPPGNPKSALARGIGMVHQHFTLADNLTVLDNILLGTQPLFALRSGKTAARARLAQLADNFGLAVPLDARVASLSVGERQRVEILKALSRNARILILDEPTAVLTPQEAENLFATLRKMTTQGLSIIFISHKLHEVMAIADRCIVLRHGRVVGDVATATTTAQTLAALMVGGTLAMPTIAPGSPGPARLHLSCVTAPGLNSLTLSLHAGTITGLAGVSGNGQAALADLIGGGLAPAAGTLSVNGQPQPNWSTHTALAAGIGRIAEDRHKQGTIADFNLAENAMLETYQTRFSRHSLINWAAATNHAKALIKHYDIRCEGPTQPIRLLSGGNMQKLILGRVLEENPSIIIASQPVRGLDVGAIAFVHSRLIAARDAGAAVLLISEDLDEILRLSDVIHVISAGCLSPAFPRGTTDAATLGLWMAGQGFDHAA